jgi:tRNA-dihydrouridine synthase A
MIQGWSALYTAVPPVHVSAMSDYRHPIAVAPMMDWTDRYCRVFHRRLTRRALLYTEMIVADAILHGDRRRLLAYSDMEHPVALQLGGSEPEKLAEAARIAADYGYDEINLNVGCPSDRVRAGTFGACLMRAPELVGDCVAAMTAAVTLPVTVKCRIGVDEQDPEVSLDALAGAVIAAGATAIWVHARKAWLRGLSPRENRDVPPLDYGRVYRLKQDRPNIFIGINGGIGTLGEVAEHLRHVDGVMIGRAAYQTPAMLADVDRRFYGEPGPAEGDLREAVANHLPEIEAWLADGRRLGAIVRPLLGVFHGAPGARAWRQILTVEASRPGAGAGVVERALAALHDSSRGTVLDKPAKSSETGVSATVAA